MPAWETHQTVTEEKTTQVPSCKANGPLFEKKPERLVHPSHRSYSRLFNSSRQTCCFLLKDEEACACGFCLSHNTTRVGKSAHQQTSFPSTLVSVV